MSLTEGSAESRWYRKAAETQIDGCVQSTRTCWLIQELEHAVVTSSLLQKSSRVDYWHWALLHSTWTPAQAPVLLKFKPTMRTFLFAKHPMSTRYRRHSYSHVLCTGTMSFEDDLCSASTMQRILNHASSPQLCSRNKRGIAKYTQFRTCFSPALRYPKSHNQ